MKSDWWRSIKHPHYGNWGGGDNKGGAKPIDKMDSYFRKHDILLRNAKNKEQEVKADKVLIKDLRKVNLADLKYKIYGTLYKYGSIAVFTIAILVRR